MYICTCMHRSTVCIESLGHVFICVYYIVYIGILKYVGICMYTSLYHKIILVAIGYQSWHRHLILMSLIPGSVLG